MSAGSRWSQVAATALDLVVPQDCAGCSVAGRVWCEACSSRCSGATIPVPMTVPCRAAAEHDGPAGRAVVAFKEHQVRRLSGPLGRMLAVAVRDVLADIDAGGPGTGVVWLLPVPARGEAMRSRGVDHTSVLAGRAAAELRRWGVSAHRCRALVSTRTSGDQVGLTRRQRLTNVHATMRALTIPAGRLVVVDDVTTTGATLQEGIRALSAAGRPTSAAASVTHAPGPRWRASGTSRS